LGRRARRRGLAPEEPRPRRARVAREREKPGAILRGPPITVTCECGTKHDLDYGERWTCEGCGRVYDSSRIPPEEYEIVRRTQLRYRILPVVLGVLVSALAVFFALSGNVFSVMFLLPLALMVWFGFLRPLHRKRYRRAIAELPRWNLRAE
jgi:hypothetical protein